MFYYGKDFGTKPQKLSPEGVLINQTYKPLSVVMPGAELPEPEEISELAEFYQNRDTTFEDILNMLRG